MNYSKEYQRKSEEMYTLIEVITFIALVGL